RRARLNRKGATMARPQVPPPTTEVVMPVETPSIFAQVIHDHLALKEQNQQLDDQMPLERYKVADPFDNHPLFKTEEQARIEETMDGQVPVVMAHAAWPGEESYTDTSGDLWGRSEEHTSELQSRVDLVCRLLLEKKKYN